jgi:hypothetical protein
MIPAIPSLLTIIMPEVANQNRNRQRFEAILRSLDNTSSAGRKQKQMYVNSRLQD